MPGWRTVAIREKSILAVQDNQLKIETEKQKCAVPLDQIGHLLLDAGAVTIPSSALSALAGEHIHIMLCGDKHLPSCEVVPVGKHHEAAGSVIDQASWQAEQKDQLWKEIVEMKLRNQERLLQYAGKLPPPSFRQYLLSVQPGDTTNREAMAAKVYYRSLFGNEFRRHHPDTLNSKLNYGYTILCSAFTRMISMHGYHTGLGIHHCSRDNPVNLSCDLMEPFRPLVDQLALESGEGELDWDLKKQMIAQTSRRCWLEGKSSTVEDAVEAFALSAFSALKTGQGSLPEVRFV